MLKIKVGLEILTYVFLPHLFLLLLLYELVLLHCLCPLSHLYSVLLNTHRHILLLAQSWSN